MPKQEWISWRLGRSFVQWHAQDTALTVKCGRVIPAQASKCYASAEFVVFAARAPKIVCTKCQQLTFGKLGLRVAERIP